MSCLQVRYQDTNWLAVASSHGSVYAQMRMEFRGAFFTLTAQFREG